MTDRFVRSRWSETRRQIDAMAKGEILTFNASQYFNAKASVDRLNDAYVGKRKWKLTRSKNTSTVTRTK
jgi:hypothetical protein